MLDLANTQMAMQLLVGFALCLQSIELLVMRRAYDTNGVWSWHVLEKEFKKGAAFFKITLSHPSFSFLVAFQIFLCVLQLWIPELVAALFLTALLITVRWRGTLNGGSDAMTLMVLIGLCIAVSLNALQLNPAPGLYFVTYHLCASYFFAGLAKIKIPEWRNGTALKLFLSSKRYAAPQACLQMAGRPRWARALSWLVMVFELTFPLSLFHPQVALVYCAVGAAFHLTNVYVLGLNRFFWAWIAAYPAFLFSSGVIHLP